MKLIKVKCPKNKKVEVEELPTKAARCPEHCPLKQKNKCFNNTFRYTAVLSDAATPDIPFAPTGDTARVTTPAPARASTPAPAVREAPIRGTTRREPPVRNGGSRAAATPVPAPAPAAEPTAAVGSPGFGYREELFAAEPETASPSVIEMDDVFGESETAMPATPAPAPMPSAERRSRTLDKYNEVLADANSLFAGVRRSNPDEPCFEDGALLFYEGAQEGQRSAGNSQAALRHIFNHWYVSRVFREEIGRAHV